MTPPESHLIAGAGLAGLSLACALLDAGVQAPITLVDRRRRFSSDRTWCLWDVGGLRWTELARHRWHRWEVRTAAGRGVGGSRRHPYLHLDAAAVYDAALDRLDRAANVDIRLGERVLAVGDGRVRTAAGGLDADRVYDALGLGSPMIDASAVGRWQTFLGQVVETAAPAFDPAACVLMDFRLPQDGELRFVYVLPFGRRRALVEHTSIGSAAVPNADRRDAIAAYLADHLGVQRFGVVAEERGRIPMTMGLGGARGGGTAVGIAAGAARPSSGYAFARTIRHVERVARAAAAGDADPGPPGGRRSQLMDAVFLRALDDRPEAFPEHFRALIADTPGDALARFMTDAATPLDEARVIAALPKPPFIAAAGGAALGALLHVRR